MWRISKIRAASPSTIDRCLNTTGLGRLRTLTLKEPVRSYQWPQSGDIINVATRQLPRFEQMSNRSMDFRQLGSSPGAGN